MTEKGQRVSKDDKNSKITRSANINVLAIVKLLNERDQCADNIERVREELDNDHYDEE